MNQDRLDTLEGRVEHLEDSNGWQSDAKYVLKKLDTLTDAVKENRIETCKKIDKLKDDNASAHKALHDKMDTQKTFCANRPVECQKAFLPNRTFHWLLIVLIVLFGATFSLSGTALKQNADHQVIHSAIKQHISEDRVLDIHDLEDFHGSDETEDEERESR